LLLQLLDGRAQLGNGRTDVGQLDDVRFGRLGQFSQAGQVVGYALPLLQPLGKLSDDPSGQGNIPGFEGDAGTPCKRLQDGQKGKRGQRRRLIDLGVDDG
jgi:hypothetical protein